MEVLSLGTRERTGGHRGYLMQGTFTHGVSEGKVVFPTRVPCVRWCACVCCACACCVRSPASMCCVDRRQLIPTRFKLMVHGQLLTGISLKGR